VVGGIDDASVEAAGRLCADLPAPVFRVSTEVAEMSKYADNAFHALKVGFANELAAVASSAGVDTEALVEVFLADTVLNVSRAYLRPGFAFGGSCLPKDVRALVHAADRAGIDVPVLGHLLASNDAVLDRTVERIAALGRRRVGVLGLAVKPGTDDLRESPLVELCRRLLDRGLVVTAHDAALPPGGPAPARLPELPRVLAASPEAVLAGAEVVVVGHPGYGPAVEVAQTLDVPVVDLCHGERSTPRAGTTGLRRAG
jgi:GDP-mannose 6-dehydrogenase